MFRSIIQISNTYGVTNIFSHTYAIARSLLATNLLLNLLFTKPYAYFSSELYEKGIFHNTFIPNFFYMFGYENFTLPIVLACIILLLVIIGYLPQITGILHAWLAYSFFNGALLLEGGDQIAQIISILLIPIALSDKRINHWHRKDFF